MLSLSLPGYSSVRTSWSSIFARGEDGFLFPSPTDLTRLYRLNTAGYASGSTRVTTDADPVGLVIDGHAWPVGVSTFDQELAYLPEAIRNLDLTTAAPGTPGTLPQNWSFRVGPGIGSVAGQVVSETADELIVRWTGTFAASGGTYFGIYFDASNVIPATAGDSWFVRQAVRLAAGSLTNITFASMSFDARSSGNAYINTPASTGFAIFLDATSREYSGFGTMNDAATAYGQPYINLLGTNSAAIDVTLAIGKPSFKKLPGNHVFQSTNTSYRPTWHDNSGKSYFSHDGSDDRLRGTFYANGSGLTIGVAMRASGANQIVVGGGNSTGNKRAYLGLDASGIANFGWGTAVAATSGADLRGTDCALLMTGDGSGRRGWVNGTEAVLGAVSGAPDGTGGPLTLGAFDNNGTQSGFLNGRIYYAFAINRKLTEAEIAFANAQLIGSY